MKRFVLLLASFFFCWGLVYFLTFRVQERTEDPLELIPQQAVLMLDWTDAARDIRDFFDLGFGRQLTGINWPSVLDQLKISEQFRNPLEEYVTSLMNFVSNPLFKEVFSRRIVCALLPIDPVALSDNPQRAVRENLIMIVQPFHGRSFARMLPLLPLKEVQTQISTYKGTFITKVFLQGDRFFYFASIKQQVVISPSPEPVKRSIDLSLSHLVRRQTGLAANSAYQALKKRARGRDNFFFYVDLARCKAMLNRLHMRMEPGKPPGTSALIGARRMVLFHHSYKNIQKFTSIVQFDPDQLLPFQKTIYTRKPVENRSLLNMPANLLVYFWSNWLDLPAWWQKILARGSPEEQVAAAGIAAWLEAQTGMKIDRFFALFGHEFGFNIAEIRTSGFFPVPRLCSCIELVDRDAVERILEKMVSGLPLKRDKVAGIPVISIMAAKGLMQPSYALLKKFLVIADSRQQIEDILEVKGRRLVEDEDFRAVDMGLLQPSNLVMFIRTAGLIDGLKEFASWAGTIIAIRDEKAGARSKILVDQVIVPLLEGLKMYRAKAVRSYTAPGELVLESVVLTEHLKDFPKN